MKVMMVHDGHQYGGLERVVCEVGGLLTQRGVGVSCLVRGDEWGKAASAHRFVVDLAAAGVDVLEAPSPKRGRLRQFRLLRRRLRAASPDLVHIHTVRVDSGRPVTAAARSLRIPVVRTEHNSPTAFSRGSFGSWRQRLFDAMTAAILTVSEHDRIEQLQLVGRSKDKVRAIVNAVDCERFVPTVSESQELAKRRAGAGLIIGTAGRLSHQKNHALLIDAFAAAEFSANRVLLAIAGSGELEGDLIDQCARLDLSDRVLLLGSIDDVKSFYDSIDIGVMSSRHEGLPLVLLEMMAVGLPTVVTDTPGLTEAVVDGVTSQVVPPDVEALALALSGLAADPVRRAQYGEAGRRHVAVHHSYDRYLADLLEVYEEVVGGSA